MSALPTQPSLTGESWEVVETGRARAAEVVDRLIESVLACDCEHDTDGLVHYDILTVLNTERWGEHLDVLSALLAVAVARLAVAQKAGER